MASCMEANKNRRAEGLRSDTLPDPRTPMTMFYKCPISCLFPAGLATKKSGAGVPYCGVCQIIYQLEAASAPRGGKRRQVSCIQLQECLHPQERSQLNGICLADVLFPVVPRMFSLQQ